MADNTRDLKKYLNDGGVEYLLVKDDKEEVAKVPIADCKFLDGPCALYFSAHWCPPCKKFTPLLAKRVREDKNMGVTVIFSSSDKNQGAFDEYYGEMPFVAIPLEYQAALKQTTAFDLPNGIPSLYIFNEEGTLYQKKGTSTILKGTYPYNTPTFQDFLGTVKTKEGKKLKNDGIEYYGLYFSASWCPPCRAFTPVLAKFYNELKQKREDFEFIFVTGDQSRPDYEQYYAKMPWCTVDIDDMFEANVVKGGVGVRGIPHLAIFDKEGNIVCKNARGNVDEDKTGENFPWPTPTVQDLGKKEVDRINDAPAMILFSKDEATLQAFKAAAEAMDGENRECYHFISNGEGSDEIASQIRKFAKVDGDGLCVFEIQKGGYYKYTEESLPSTADGFVNFWTAVKGGDITLSSMN